MQTYIDETTFKGHFLKGERHGMGQFAWKDGIKFETNFKEGKLALLND